MPEPFEYAIRKDVRNNPIVRELDKVRQQELWTSVGMAAFLVLVLLVSAWQHFELLQHGYEVEQMQRERAVEEDAARQLRLEIGGSMRDAGWRAVDSDTRRRLRDGRAGHGARYFGELDARIFRPVPRWASSSCLVSCHV